MEWALSMIEKENTIKECCYDPLHYPGFLTFTACHITCSAPLIKIKLFTYDMLHLSSPVYSLFTGLFWFAHSRSFFPRSGSRFFVGDRLLILQKFWLKLPLAVYFASAGFFDFPFGLQILDFKCFLDFSLPCLTLTCSFLQSVPLRNSRIPKTFPSAARLLSRFTAVSSSC